uniref:Uncharacterized protein n=1 Tax=Arundo donax TaxID=35708 RepID=A0A0A9E098_ARUDO
MFFWLLDFPCLLPSPCANENKHCIALLVHRLV